MKIQFVVLCKDFLLLSLKEGETKSIFNCLSLACNILQYFLFFLFCSKISYHSYYRNILLYLVVIKHTVYSAPMLEVHKVENQVGRHTYKERWARYRAAYLTQETFNNIRSCFGGFWWSYLNFPILSDILDTNEVLLYYYDFTYF